MKYAIRPLDFAIVSVAVRVVAAADGTIADARIGLAGAANHTLRATEAERVLVGERAVGGAARARRPGGGAAGRAAGGRRRHRRTTSGASTGVFTARALARALE